MNARAHLLIAEDNDIDAEHVIRCVTRNGFQNPLIRALDGREALEVLRGRGTYGLLGDPHVVLLDLNMPGMDGLEFLSKLRNDADLADTPVIVLTTSELPADVAEAHRLGADGYLTKPITLVQLRRIIDTVERSASTG